MSLFSQLAGEFLGAQDNGGSSPLLQVAQQLLDQHGGIAGLVQQFSQSGLGEQVSSWVGTGENLPVDASQIADVLGQGALGEMASRFGLDPQQLAGGLAQALPTLIDQLTPDGQVQGGNALLSEGLSMLEGLLAKR